MNCCSKKIFKYHLFGLNKKVSLPAFLLLSLFAGTQQAQAARAPINVDYAGKTYCIGFDNSVDYTWPGQSGGKNLQPNEAGAAGVVMSEWKYADAPWWSNYGNNGNDKSKKNLAKNLSEELPGYFVWKTGSGNQPNGFISGENVDSYLSGLPAGQYNFFGSENFSNKETYIAYVESEGECVGDDGIVNIDGIIGELGDPDLATALLEKLSGISPEERKKRLGEVVSALLLPRNVIAAGGLATQAFSNDLADTILDQLPTRYLMEVEEEIAIEIDEVETEEEVVPSGEPVRGLWMKDGEVEDAQASDYLDKTLIASASQSTDALEIGELNYVEDQDPRSAYRNGGMRAWVKGFAGSMSPFSTGGLEKNGIYYPDVYNDFYSTHGGVVVGVDAPVADKVQVGVFGHYGSISLNQFAGEFTGSGSWNPSGWGGGLTASYVDKGFYVQGLFGATSFSGENKRQVLLGGVIDETYTATKNTTSYVGALRVGAPLLWGGVIVDPQLTATWNGNNDASYTESGRYDALALKVKSYSDQFLQTALGSKFSWPIPYDNGNLLTPSLRVAWLADWNTNNGAASVQRANAENPTTAKIPSNQEMENGVLLEGGVDYSIFGGESSSWMLYAKGGAKVWFSKSADWRASGGVTFRF